MLSIVASCTAWLRPLHLPSQHLETRWAIRKPSHQNHIKNSPTWYSPAKATGILWRTKPYTHKKIMQNLLWTKVLQSLALGQHKTTGWVISASMEQDVTNMHQKRGIPEIFPSHGDQGSFTAIAAGEALPQHPQFAELTLPSRKHQVKGKEQQSC